MDRTRFDILDETRYDAPRIIHRSRVSAVSSLVDERGSRLIQGPVKYGLDEAAQQRVSDNGERSSRPYYWIMRRSIIRAAFVSARSHLIGWKVPASPLPSSLFSSSFPSLSSSSSSSFSDLVVGYVHVHVAVSISASSPPLFPPVVVLSLVREVLRSSNIYFEINVSNGKSEIQLRFFGLDENDYVLILIDMYRYWFVRLDFELKLLWKRKRKENIKC